MPDGGYASHNRVEGGDIAHKGDGIQAESYIRNRLIANQYFSRLCAMPSSPARHTQGLRTHIILIYNIPTPSTPNQCAGDPNMTRIQIDLPDATAQAARDAGLLTPEGILKLLSDALRRRQAIDSLLSVADRVAAAGIPPMTMEEINAEVKAARAERHKNAGGH